MLYRHHYRHQQELAGHRAVALQLYNAVGGFSEGFKPLSEAQYWPLPLLDPAPGKAGPADDAAWWDKMRALATASGKSFAAINS